MCDFTHELLDKITEGIIIINDRLEIEFWNTLMEDLTKIDESVAVGKSVYQIVPNLDKLYFRNTINNVLATGTVMFFSAAMHKNILNKKDSLNFKISRLKKDNSNYLIIEFINVTGQMQQINQLKQYISELSRVNTELKVKEKIIKELAYYDNLTGVANRTLFYKIADKNLKSCKKQKSMLALLFIDIDKFKYINDTYGHVAGDKILVKIAGILNKSIGTNDLVARYGGDEFLVLLPHIKETSDYENIIAKINDYKNTHMSVNNQKISFSVSIGLSLYPQDGDTIDKLMVKADESMYLKKKILD